MRVEAATGLVPAGHVGGRFAVLQPGARMHDAVPSLFKRAGMPGHFSTDVVGNLGLTAVSPMGVSRYGQAPVG